MVRIRIYVYFQSIVSLFLVKEREWEDWTRALIINTAKHLTIFSFFQCNLVCLSISIFFLSSVSLFPVNEIEREDWTRNLKKKNSKTFATLRRWIFVNINFHEINFLVDFFFAYPILSYFAWIYFWGWRNLHSFPWAFFRGCHMCNVCDNRGEQRFNFCKTPEVAPVESVQIALTLPWSIIGVKVKLHFLEIFTPYSI